MKIGWIGSGLMGSPMVRRVLEGGHDVSVYSRSPAASGELVALGAQRAASLREAVVGRDIVISVLAMPADVRDVYLGLDGILSFPDLGGVMVDMTTSSPALARELAAAGTAVGVQVLDAPVSGGPFGAERGALSAMVGGERSALERVEPVLACMASTIVHHGLAGSGQYAKLVNQVLVGGMTYAVCESFALAVSGGLDGGRVLESMQAGAVASPLLGFLWAKLNEHDASPGFKIDHLIKDLDLVLEEAAAVHLRLAAVERVRQAAASLGSPRGGTQTLLASMGDRMSGWFESPAQ